MAPSDCSVQTLWDERTDVVMMPSPRLSRGITVLAIDSIDGFKNGTRYGDEEVSR